jgi:D-glycero-D-manno-heptose 1,7-bisphosphate phosphatase
MARPARPLVVLLDRDGTINRRVVGGYVTSWEGFAFLPGALRGLADLARAGATVAVVTNQAAVDKGLLTRAALARLHARMAAAVTAAGGRLHGVYVCPHRPERGCACRKPRPGLILRAAADLGFDPRASFLVGDSLTDVAAGAAAGCRTVLLAPGAAAAPGGPGRPDHVAPDLRAAAALIRRLAAR